MKTNDVYLFLIFNLLMINLFHGVSPTIAYAKNGLNEIDVRTFANLSAAITSPSTKDKTIIISNDQTINSAIIPADRSIRVGRNGSIYVNASHTLIINGPFAALPDHIFKGHGLIKFGKNTAKRIYPQWWGAKGDGVNDDTPHIQAAINSSTSSDHQIYIKSGTYRIVPGIVTFDEAGPSVHVAIIMKSNMHILAESNALFKIIDKFSTDSSPKRMHMFFTNSVVENISINGLTFDMNGVNNKISPLRPLKYNRYNQAAIAVSGTSRGVAARADNVNISHCSFINTPGTSSIIMTLSNTKNIIISKNWTISNCFFNNNGIDTDDHSSIFGWADDVICTNNIFTADTMWGANGSTGAKVAMEIHGSRHIFTGNRIRNYYQGLWVASNYTSPADNVTIADNDIGPVRAIGIASFRTVNRLTPVTNVLIKSNKFIIDDTLDKVDLKAAVRIASECKISNWIITDNTMDKLGTSTNAVFGLVVSQNISCGEHDNIKFKSNKIHNSGVGFYIKSSVNTGIGHIEILDNEIYDTVAQSNYKPIGIMISGISPIKSIVSSRNIFINKTQPLLYGHYVTGSIEELNISDNTYINVMNPYTEAKAKITKRTGNELPK